MSLVLVVRRADDAFEREFGGTYCRRGDGSQGNVVLIGKGE